MNGKMYGVMLARRPDGSLVTLRAFSGMLDGQWNVEGFVPPLFDAEARAAIEPAGDARVKELSAMLDAGVHERLLAKLTEQEQQRADIRERHRRNRDARKLQPRTHALDQESRRDKAERKRFEDGCLAEPLHKEARRQRAIERVRRMTSAKLMKQIHDTYTLHNAAGETRSLRALFAPHEPPAGAGDCAAPKLYGHAFAHGLEPIAVKEFFWGEGAREHGQFYPPCDKKCGPILAFMLGTPEPRIVYEDDAIVVLEKPSGLLSVPGKSATPSVLSWLRARYPEALLAHRLDQDTSGLLIAGKTLAAYKHLQQQFAERAVEKRYAAVLDGALEGEGSIDLPLRVDLANRPRQIHDPVHGYAARTDWRAHGSRVTFFPRTGRTHQLRVHAALGLGMPIVGDRLYGTPGPRLLLHAEAIVFAHPSNGARMSFDSPAPF